MKPVLPWHHTLIGRIAFFLGGLKLAVPVLLAVAAALAWGTYLDSTHGAKAARATVYGSWWFIGLMALVCVSLVFAVVTRFPWQRKHLGFMTVHASLIALILGGFWSMFGRVEGRIILEAGSATNALLTDDERVELLRHDSGQFTTIGGATFGAGAADATLDGLTLHVTDRWENTREELEVTDDGPEPMRAMEVTFDPDARKGTWIGEESRGGAVTMGAMRIRLLAAGQAFQPPPPGAAPASVAAGGYAFVVGDKRYPLGTEGDEALPGWTVKTVRRFVHAIVGGGGLTEGEAGRDNPAVEVFITDGQGTVEQHVAFQNFPDMVMAKAVEGQGHSGATLAPTAVPSAGATLVVYGDPQALKAAYLATDGTVQQYDHDGSLPWAFEAGQRRITILRQCTRARAAVKLVPAPHAEQSRPSLIVRVGDEAGASPVPLPWNTPTPVSVGGRVVILRYGPRTVDLPFTLRLDKFRKMDYPGTEMAMAYESDVTVDAPGHPDRSTTISMNNPLKQSGWKVYQSGFSGTTISIFSVMKDPGLTLTYIGATGLCLGILVTFYGRSFSAGHPGIPGLFAPAARSSPAAAPVTPSLKEQPHVSPHPAGDRAVPVAAGHG